MATFRDFDYPIRINGDLLVPSSYKVQFGGSVTAESFSGDGSAITNLSSSAMPDALLLNGSRAMTGALRIKPNSSGNAIFVESGNYDTILRMAHNTTQFGFDLKYTGTETSANNSLELWTDGDGASGSAKVFRVQQDGILRVIQGLDVSGNITATEQTLTIGTVNADTVTASSLQEGNTDISNIYTPLTRTISTGAGLSGGGNLSANRTLSINFAGTGSAVTAARSDHDHDGVYEPVFTKKTAFNKNFGTTAGTVAEGNHDHDDIYEPIFSKNTAFNKNFGTVQGTVAEGNHHHDDIYAPIHDHPYLPSNAPHIKLDTTGGTTYARMVFENNPASSNDYVRVPSSLGGLLPYAAGQSKIGTSSWNFGEIHSISFYENGTALSSKYLGISSNAVSASKWNTARTITLSGDASGSVSLDGSQNVTLSVTVADDSHNHTISNIDGLQTALNNKASNDHHHNTMYLGINATAVNANKLNNLESSQFVRSDQNTTIDAGESTTLTILSDDTGESAIELYGASQGTGRIYVGQSKTHGGGIEYNGDNIPVTSDAGSDYIALYRRSSGTNYWTARNFHSSNNWLFRGEIYALENRLVFHEGNLNPVETSRKINAGTGLNGGGALSSDITLSVSFSGSGSATTAARSDHDHDGIYEPLFTKNSAFNKNFGTSAGTVAQGNDSRFHTHSNKSTLDNINQSLSTSSSPSFNEVTINGLIVNGGAKYQGQVTIGHPDNNNERWDILYSNSSPNDLSSGVWGLRIRDVSHDSDRLYIHRDSSNSYINISGQLHINNERKDANWDAAYAHSQESHAPANANYYVHPTGFTSQPATALTGANVISRITINNEGHVTGVSTRTLTKANIGLGNTENKSSATIRGEITSMNVTNALGYTPAVDSHDHDGIYEPVFSKRTAFNKDFGTTSNTVAEGDHDHDSDYYKKPEVIDYLDGLAIYRWHGNEVIPSNETIDTATFSKDFGNVQRDRLHSLQIAVKHLDLEASCRIALNDTELDIFHGDDNATQWTIFRADVSLVNEANGNNIKIWTTSSDTGTVYEVVVYALSEHDHLASDVIEDSTHRFTTDTEKSNWNSAYSHAQEPHAPANANYYVHPEGFSNQPASPLTGAEIISQVKVNSEGHITGVGTRILNLTDVGLDYSPVNREGDKLTGSLTWEGSQKYKGIYWGQLEEKSNPEYGQLAFIRQGTSEGQLEIGSDELISIYETDAMDLAIQISTNNKTLDAKGGLKENGVNLSSKYLGIDAVAKDSEKLDGVDSSRYARTDIDENFEGKVGIGTNTPEESLDVQGSVRIREENELKFGGTGASDIGASMKYNTSTKSIDFIFA